MSTNLPPHEILGPLKRFAEGQMEPEEWLDWWAENLARVEAVVSRGAFLRLRPRSDRTVGPNYAAAPSHPEACKLLDQFQTEYVGSDRYTTAAEQEFRAWAADRQAREDARKREFLPILKQMERDFPKLSRCLRRRLDRIEQMQPGASEDELTREEAALGVALPDAYRRWLRAVRVLELDTLKFAAEHPFVVRSPTVALPSEGMLCIADYALEADGDQVLLDPRLPGDDPPVFYYAHGVPEVRALAPSFTAWIESLPKSPALRED